ncbi:MAG: phosphoadenosine phosphosulfate reductase family protein [Candidatus Methanoplasma sp.]|jgi:phosphoadenosine phosphosulfate reductase|nr:phosphoadenosine phosphosulfate reductase family protein [Candidatus Methanoplasma sp.]
MGAVVLGKNHLRWCRGCNLPILESPRCAACGSKTIQVEITPPADARPAFKHSIDLVRRLADEAFGDGCGLALLPEGRLAILNKCPSIDRMDEIVCDGAVVAGMRYDIGAGWKLMLRMQGAMRLEGVMSKGYVVCDPGAVPFIRDSRNLMAPGVLDAHPEVEAGDEVVIIDPDRKAVATGSARMPAAEMREGGRGVAVKTRWYKSEEPVASEKGGTWEDAVSANREVIGRRAAEAVAFIKDTMEKKGLPAAVSFSGGKDSLATLLLTLDAGLKLPVMFADTGLEFTETVEHVRETAERHGLPLLMEKAPENAFFGNLGAFGPPAKDFRWCCKTNKLGPTVAAVERNFPGGVLAFIGQRKYESEARNSKPRVWSNPWTPGQIGASPIQSWCAMHVWLYIFSKREPFNVWYERGLDRIGCFLCPASDLSDLEAVSKGSDRFPEWEAFLDRYMEENSLPREWKEFGLWRWKSAPQSVREEVKRVTGRDLPDMARRAPRGAEGPVGIKIQEGHVPCSIGYSIEAALSRPIDLKRLKPFAHALGWVVELDEEGNTLSADYVTFYGDGAIISKANIERDARVRMDHAYQLVARSEQCVGCGLCAARCEPGALYMDGGKVAIREDDCVFCRKCFGPCPAARFGTGDEAFEQ